MTQSKIREEINHIVQGNLTWCDPKSRVCRNQNQLHPKRFPIGSTFQSAEEVLDDIICDLTSLQNELSIESVK